MYGFIYQILKSLVVENHGEEAWQHICEEVGLSELQKSIVDRQVYDEAILTKVGTAAAKLLGTPLDAILESFGAHFFQKIKASGHSNMLRTLGHNLYGFLMNLDSLHDHLSFTYTQMEAPSFRCEKTRTGLTLHYYSKRKGLYPIVVGIVKAVAADFYNLDVDIRMERQQETKEMLRYYYVLQIEARDSCKDETYLERLKGESNTVDFGLPTVPSDTELTIIPTEHHSRPSSLAWVPWGHIPCPYAPSGHLGRKSQSTGQVINVEPCEPAVPILDPVDFPISPVASEASDILSSAEMADLLQQQLRLPNPILPALSSRMNSRRGSMMFHTDPDWPISPQLFQNCFPFHIIFDRDLVIRHIGVSLGRLFPKAIICEAKLTDYFVLSRPAVALTYQNIRSYVHNIFIMSTKKCALPSKNCREALQFRGQMVPTSSKESSLILFLGSPRISSVEELEFQGLYLSDIPVHDVTRDLILLNGHFRVEMKIAKELEETKRDLEIQKAQVQEEKARADRLLHAMLPSPVALELKNGANASATEYSMVTILFSDIKSFTTICSQCHAMQVVGMLNELYTRFDNLIEKHNVYKVETIGDAYMVAAGLLHTSQDHAEAVTNMAFDMREEASKVKEPANGESLQIRIGIHSGPVVAGVVGQKMPRYCLFGDTVNTASRMESHGSPGCIHISDITYPFLRHNPAYQFYSRGMIFVKGLGERQTYFVELAKEYDGTTRIMVHSGSESQDSEVEIPNSFLPLPSEDNFSRSPSFVKDKHIRLVKPGSSSGIPLRSQQDPFAHARQSVSSTEPNLPHMVRPKMESFSRSPPGYRYNRGRISNCSNASTITFTVTNPDPLLPQGLGASSCVTQDSATDSEEAERPSKSKKSKKHKNKCKIS